jgi:hypothetical protein
VKVVAPMLLKSIHKQFIQLLRQQLSLRHVDRRFGPFPFFLEMFFSILCPHNLDCALSALTQYIHRIFSLELSPN